MLYSIAVCDDNEHDLQKIQDWLIKFSIESNIEFNIDKFSNGESLIKEYEQTLKKFDIIFLDVEMSGLSGIDVAEKVRSLPDRNVLIIFVTSYPEYMQDSFDVQASQYLIKPLSYAVFKEKLSKMIGYLIDLETNIKVISMKSEEYILHLEDIVCFETLKSPTIKSTLVVTTTGGEIQIKGKIIDFENELADKFFISVHRSVLVNMRYIRRFNAHTLEFTTGKRVEISRRKISEVKDAFSKYMVMRYRR